MTAAHGAPRRPVLLVILDGFGVNPGKLHNAVALAKTPNLDAYFSRYAHTLLQASGHAVGLPDGQMGNSEVGHLTLGCGAIVRQDLVRIGDSIENASFFENPVLNAAMDAAVASGRPLHLYGLVSDGGVHSHLAHLFALLELCRRRGARPLLHMVTDGRDTHPQSALGYLEQLQPKLEQAGGSVGTLSGRFYAMDRDRRWERTEAAWRAMVLGKGRHCSSARHAIESAYASGESDEFIRPCLMPTWEPVAEGEPMISFNFRKDRPRQMVGALGSEDFAGFDRGGAPRFRVFCMMQYDRNLGMPFAFEHEAPQTTLSQVISAAGLRQLHCAETEKYAHVTYFLDGGRQDPAVGERHLLIPSPRVATYDQKPEMSAPQVADSVINALDSGEFAFIVVNFANGDMVGHTAVPQAVIRAVEALDREVGRVLDRAADRGYAVVLTADHGNCEEMVDPSTGAPHTQHTCYPVPCLIIDEAAWLLSSAGGLSNIAPTVLQLLGLPKPEAMPASSLLLRPTSEDVGLHRLEGAA